MGIKLKMRQDCISVLTWMGFLKLCPKKLPHFLHWHRDTLPQSQPPHPRPFEQEPGHGVCDWGNFHLPQTGRNQRSLFQRPCGPTQATMLCKERAVTLLAEPAAGWFGLSGDGEAWAGGRNLPQRLGEVPRYLHELRGSPAHRLGGGDQPLRPARVLGVKLLSCCCPLLL